MDSHDVMAAALTTKQMHTEALTGRCTAAPPHQHPHSGRHDAWPRHQQHLTQRWMLPQSAQHHFSACQRRHIVIANMRVDQMTAKGQLAEVWRLHIMAAGAASVPQQRWQISSAGLLFLLNCRACVAPTVSRLCAGMTHAGKQLVPGPQQRLPVQAQHVQARPPLPARQHPQLVVLQVQVLQCRGAQAAVVCMMEAQCCRSAVQCKAASPGWVQPAAHATLPHPQQGQALHSLRQLVQLRIRQAEGHQPGQGRERCRMEGDMASAVRREVAPALLHQVRVIIHCARPPTPMLPT